MCVHTYSWCGIGGAGGASAGGAGAGFGAIGGAGGAIGSGRTRQQSAIGSGSPWGAPPQPPAQQGPGTWSNF